MSHNVLKVFFKIICNVCVSHLSTPGRSWAKLRRLSWMLTLRIWWAVQTAPKTGQKKSTGRLRSCCSPTQVWNRSRKTVWLYMKTVFSVHLIIKKNYCKARGGGIIWWWPDWHHYSPHGGTETVFHYWCFSVTHSWRIYTVVAFFGHSNTILLIYRHRHGNYVKLHQIYTILNWTN